MIESSLINCLCPEMRKAELMLKTGQSILESAKEVEGALATTYRSNLRKKLMKLDSLTYQAKTNITFMCYRPPWTKETSDEKEEACMQRRE